MRSGALRKRVMIQKPVAGGPDALNERTFTWTDEQKIWVGILPQSGREFYRAQQVNAAVTHLVSARYRTGLDATKRLVLSGSRVLDIDGVLDVDERHEELLLTCVEDTP